MNNLKKGLVYCAIMLCANVNYAQLHINKFIADNSTILATVSANSFTTIWADDNPESGGFYYLILNREGKLSKPEKFVLQW